MPSSLTLMLAGFRSVDDALLMGRIQGFGDLSRNRQRVFDWHRAVRDAVGQRRPLDQQDERPRPLGLPMP